MKRVVVEELLDSDAGTPAEVAGSIKDRSVIASRTLSSIKSQAVVMSPTR